MLLLTHFLFLWTATTIPLRCTEFHWKQFSCKERSEGHLRTWQRLTLFFRPPESNANVHCLRASVLPIYKSFYVHLHMHASLGISVHM